MGEQEKEPKIFFRELVYQTAQFNKKWEKTDERRQIFFVRFNDGSIWYPKGIEIKAISAAMEKCYAHNIQFPNIDKPKGCENEPNK